MARGQISNGCTSRKIGRGILSSSVGLVADQIGLSVDTMTHDYGVGRLASWLTYPPQQAWWASAVDPRPATTGGMTQRIMIGGSGS